MSEKTKIMQSKITADDFFSLPPKYRTKKNLDRLFEMSRRKQLSGLLKDLEKRIGEIDYEKKIK